MALNVLKALLVWQPSSLTGGAGLWHCSQLLGLSPDPQGLFEAQCQLKKPKKLIKTDWPI
jgi:hypothetical protein